MIKNIPFTGILLILYAALMPVGSLMAMNGEELYLELFCHTCHNIRGKGMRRPGTRAVYQFKKDTFYRLRQGEVPDSVLKKLSLLTGKKYKKRKEFIRAIRKILDKEYIRLYKDIIVKAFRRVIYRKNDPIPGFAKYPVLAGNKKIYLYNQMRDIIQGRRLNGETETMRGIKPLLEKHKITDKELMLIAEYLSVIRYHKTVKNNP